MPESNPSRAASGRMLATAPAPSRRSRSRRRRLALGVAGACFLGFCLVEGTLRALTAPRTGLGVVALGRVTLVPWRPSPGTVRGWQRRAAEAKYMVPDPDLGWTLGASATSESEGYSYTTNAQGLRAAPDRVYAPAPPPGKVRLVCVGDSFTHCDEVSLADTWEARLEALDGRLEVLNLGTPAYGTDQAFLRWRKEGRAFQTHAVVLGVWPENMCRNLNLIRFWLSPLSGFSPKPRFVLAQGGELRLVNSPVPQGEDLIAAVTDPAAWGPIVHERWYEPTVTHKYLTDNSRTLRVLRGVLYARERQLARRRIYSGEDPEGIHVTTAIARKFAAEVAETGAVPLIALMPMKDLLDEWPEDDDLPLVVELRRAGLTVINLFPAARAAGPQAFLPSGHLTPAGQAAVAAELERQLPGLIPALGAR